GIDHDTGAHILFTFVVPADHQPQTMELVLTLGEELSDCSNGSAREVYANATNRDARSIDGLLCKFRPPWTRYKPVFEHAWWDWGLNPPHGLDGRAKGHGHDGDRSC